LPTTLFRTEIEILNLDILDILDVLGLALALVVRRVVHGGSVRQRAEPDGWR
jgi:hypothetical protein